VLANLFNHPVTPLNWGVAICAAAVAMVCDVRTRRIPNLLTLPLLALGLIAATATHGFGSAGLVNSLLGFLILFIPYVVLFIVAGGGGGDAKIMGAIGAWVGAAGSVPVLVAVMVCGAVFGLIYASMRGRLRPVLGNMWVMGQGLGRVASGMQSPRDAAELMPSTDVMLKMPYGVAVCAGVCIVAAAKVLPWI
jgi:prepilin peptidase CpaA